MVSGVLMKKGQLTETFDKQVGDHLGWATDQSLSHDEELELKLFHYGNSEGGAINKLGHHARNSESLENFSGKNTEEKKRKKFQDLIHRIEQARKQLDELLALVNQRLEEIKIERDNIMIEVARLGTEIASIKAAREEFKETCELELNEDGELADPILEKIIQEWEKKNGKKVDRDNFGLIDKILLDELKLANQELGDLEVQDKTLEQEQTTLGKVKDDINEVKHKLDSSDPEEQLEALSQVPELSEITKGYILEEKVNLSEEEPVYSSQTTAVTLDNKFSF